VLGGTCALLGAFECGKIVISQALSKVTICHWWVIYLYTTFAKGSHEVYLGCIFLKIANIMIILDQVFAENT
jgi:vacuolar-type H+-ATPase catalytic subunit A/Vma1